MQREVTATAVLYVLAVGLSLAVWLASPTPDLLEDEFTGEGELFFPELTSAESIHGLEVRAFDVSQNRVDNFRVEEAPDGKWVIPSHHNYPADAKEELGKVVLSFMGLKKEKMVARAVAEHETFGVIDPDDKSVESIGGRGRKILFRDDKGKIVAQYIVGKSVDSSGERYYLRVPDEKRVYAVKFKPHLSTSFGDWINPDLLQLQPDEIQKILVHNYSVNETNWPNFTTIPHDSFSLSRLVDKDHPEPGALILDGLSTQEEMNQTNLDELIDTLCNLRIVGVRSIQEYFQTEGVLQSGNDMQFRGAGFFFRDGKTYANEGDIVIVTKDGVTMQLCFGELTGGVGEALTAGVNAKEEAELNATPGEKKWNNRYLLIMVGITGKPPEPGSPDSPALIHARELAERVGQYFFVISDEKLARLHRRRNELTQKKVAPATPANQPPGTQNTPATPAPTGTNDNIVPAQPPAQTPAQPAPAPVPVPAEPPAQPPTGEKPADPPAADPPPAAEPPAANPPAQPPQ